jgi:hypothetical protein
MTEKTHERLGDKILQALNLSLNQKDVAISEILSRALDMSMTRNAGGRDFIERREFTEEVKSAIMRLDALKKASKGIFEP